MEVLLLAVMAASNIACFVIGARIGQKVVKGEEVQMPTVNPMQAVRDRQARHQADMEKQRLDTILHNIDSYDGTERGQEDVPGR